MKKSIGKVGRLDAEKMNVVLLGSELIGKVLTRRKSTNQQSYQKITKLDAEKMKVLLSRSEVTRKVWTRRK